jgi:hypothetical protein
MITAAAFTAGIALGAAAGAFAGIRKTQRDNAIHEIRAHTNGFNRGLAYYREQQRQNHPTARNLASVTDISPN